MPTRQTELLAPAKLSALIAKLTELTTNQPTTAEIEEAYFYLLPQIDETLRSWFSSRHLIQAQAHQAAIFAERHPNVVEVMRRLTPGQQALRKIADLSAAEDEAMDELEARQAVALHPIFHGLLSCVRPA